MAGDSANVRQWDNADVYVSFDLSAAIPEDVVTPFDGDWDLVGLLDGDTGIAESRAEDETDMSAWGGILIRTSRRNYKETWGFTALEWNDTTKRLYRPPSPSPIWTVPRITRVKVAFETRDGDYVHRAVSTFQAEIKVDGDVVRNEPDIASVAFVATIYPNADGELFSVQDTPEGPYFIDGNGFVNALIPFQDGPSLVGGFVTDDVPSEDGTTLTLAGGLVLLTIGD